MRENMHFSAVLRKLRQGIACLSLVVVLCVFWSLKLTGISMAGEAFCGMDEHVHDAECIESGTCTKQIHIHTASCYSNSKADLETPADWEKSLAHIDSGTSLAERITAIAASQLGQKESVLNFRLDEAGVRRGITRYGQWYGNPYGSWSAMFVSFCLSQAGLTELPANAGPESMRLEWEAEGLYSPAGTVTPQTGQLLFLDKDGNGVADAVAIISGVTDRFLTVIEGDLEDTVAESLYDRDGETVMGYGRVPLVPELTLLPNRTETLIGMVTGTAPQLTEGNHLIVYRTDDTGHYAVDGNGELVPVRIDSEGRIYTENANPSGLLWQVTSGRKGQIIENLTTGLYLPDTGSTYAVNAVGGGTAYAQAVDYRVWLDGTNGGLMTLRGSANQRYTVTGGTTFVLPETWQSPGKYAYTLRGWYDINNNKYYAPGDTVTINGNTVFYADWQAATYDIGQFNAQVTNTISTNRFVTTRMFDYGALFNLLSTRVDVTNNNNNHTEVWHLLTSGNNRYDGKPVTGFIFRDWDANEDISWPQNTNDANMPTDAGNVYPGLYNTALRDLLFDPELQVLGKQYLGEGDHLFQLCTDPAKEYYGYYYYSSELNAASYNQTDQRFYVYNYLACTRDSRDAEVGKNSDFLPLNSPYANTNGKTVNTFQYEGNQGEYQGTTHYMYDSRYDDSGNSTSNVHASFWFGMSIDIEFYIPNAPGTALPEGGYGNQDVYGNDMHFKFSGDDDVWVLVDGKLVLDLGGVHGIESGDINFATGEVYVNGTRNQQLTDTLRTITAGEHVLSLYYLERGSSMSNCSIYFNLAPRFSFSIQKEDVLTRDVLNGAQFSVFTDEACTVPAQLWTDAEAKENGKPATHVFTVENGIATMWGMGAGNTYYIKETKAPDDPAYGFPTGIIRVVFDKGGTASYSVEKPSGGGVSPGFTVHGFRIDEQTQEAYIVATNAPVSVTETTGVWAFKKWNDALDHSGDVITVYLTVTDPDGTVRRLQEAQLSAENNWIHHWENLPKYIYNTTTEVVYGVEEAYHPGYFGEVTKTDSLIVATTTWKDTNTLENGKSYLLRGPSGYLSTLNGNADTGFMWVDEETAKSSPLALWTAKTKGNLVMLTNAAGQTLSFYYGNGSPTDFFASTATDESNNVKRYFATVKFGAGIRLYYDDSRDYYLTSSLNGSQKFSYNTSANQAMTLVPVTKTTTTTTHQIEGFGYQITNTPLERETSVTVFKGWDYGLLPNSNLHEKAQVTVKLFANGKDTGRTVTLSLSNGWTGSFKGLPYEDANGDPIAYTVEEVWEDPDWTPAYGAILTSGGTTPTYSTTITNEYVYGHGEIFPETGSPARSLFMLCGAGILLVTLVYAFSLRRRRERRSE